MTNESLRRFVTRALDNAKLQLSIVQDDVDGWTVSLDRANRRKAHLETEVAELTEALDAIEADAVITVTDGIITKE